MVWIVEDRLILIDRLHLAAHGAHHRAGIEPASDEQRHAAGRILAVGNIDGGRRQRFPRIRVAERRADADDRAPHFRRARGLLRVPS